MKFNEEFFLGLLIGSFILFMLMGFMGVFDSTDFPECEKCPFIIAKKSNCFNATALWNNGEGITNLTEASPYIACLIEDIAEGLDANSGGNE